MTSGKHDRADGWLNNLIRKYQLQRHEEKALRRTTDEVVTITDPRIRGVSRYWKPLRTPIVSATHYCQSLLATIPGPIHLSRESYHGNPNVKALFPSSDNLMEFLQICPELAELRKQDSSSSQIVALMTMAREEKTIYDYQQHGERVMQDVAQQAVNFSDHRLVAPATDLDETREGVVRRGLEVLATLAMEQIETLQGKKAELQQKTEYLRATLRILGGRAHMLEVFAAPEAGKWEEYRKAEHLLAEVEEQLSQTEALIGRPEQSLDYLSDILQSPEQALTAQHQTMRLDWKNVRVDDIPDIKGDDISFAEFAIPDVMQRSALFVSFSGSAMHRS